MQTSPVWLLTLLFIGLKLTNYIDWSWWWVLAPIWLPLTFLVGIFLLVGMMIFFGGRDYTSKGDRLFRTVKKYLLKVISFIERG